VGKYKNGSSRKMKWGYISNSKKNDETLLLEKKSRVEIHNLYTENSCVKHYYNINVVKIKVMFSDVCCITMHMSVISKSEIGANWKK
jgi:hypothetical protein